MPERDPIRSQGDLIIDVEAGDSGPFQYYSTRFGTPFQASKNGDFVVRTGEQESLRIKASAGTTQFGASLGLDGRLIGSRLNVSEVFSYSGTSGHFSNISAEATVIGTSPAGPTSREQGFQAWVKDATAVSNHSVSGAANNGSGLIRLTVTGHG